MTESHIRQDKATRQWVIYAPSRGKRPHDFKQTKKKTGRLPEYDKDCPFCLGNEYMLEKILMEMGDNNPTRWRTRVVPNKFPALTPNGDTERSSEGIYITMKGYGQHDVIIESPLHNQQIASMAGEDVEMVIETYHRRYLQVLQEHGNMMTIIFRNHGSQAGTSLIHPHSQLIATGMVPHYVRWREEEAQRYHDEWGRCVYCDILDFESEHGRRVLYENDSFLGYIPFAAQVPFEIWIVPKNHQADFAQVSDAEKSDLAPALQFLLTRLYEKLNDPDYNYVINTSPQYRAGEPQFHWYLQIRPRLTTQAGFEIGSGISINPSLPESDADFLNEIKRKRP
ncbi:MAG: galactose-1-phosphate uridylyltransferase [Desulfobacteraceae bacterium]